MTKEIGLIGGLEKRLIEIRDYDPDWSKKFEMHAGLIRESLGKAAERLEHVGSTSVPGLAAKPIIDILLVVEDSADEDSYLPLMEGAGYVLRVREPDFHEHRMFRTPARDVHVHVLSRGSREVDRLLTFRDRLRSNVGERKEYEAVKRSLAGQPWPDMNAYAAAKSETVERIIAAAESAVAISKTREIARS
jgi:GrpB-like predicted nucleotidyltransferase (UPF0157 family)